MSCELWAVQARVEVAYRVGNTYELVENLRVRKRWSRVQNLYERRVRARTVLYKLYSDKYENSYNRSYK